MTITCYGNGEEGNKGKNEAIGRTESEQLKYDDNNKCRIMYVVLGKVIQKIWIRS